MSVGYFYVSNRYVDENVHDMDEDRQGRDIPFLPNLFQNHQRHQKAPNLKRDPDEDRV